MRHYRIIDTALIFTDSRGHRYRPALRALSHQHLGKTIQDSPRGHDPVEDARTCMELVKLKIEKGEKFGHHVSDYLNVFDEISEHTGKKVYIMDTEKSMERNSGDKVEKVVMDSQPVVGDVSLI